MTLRKATAGCTLAASHPGTAATALATTLDTPSTEEDGVFFLVVNVSGTVKVPGRAAA